MPRFFDPKRYNEDWYVALRGEYQKFFDYIVEMCDNAGVWKPNKLDFETKTGFKLNLDSFLQKVNGDKERVLVLDNGRWFLPGFIKYQWFNKKSSFELSSTHPLHVNIIVSLEENQISPTLVKGLVKAWQAFKDKDKDKDKDKVLGNRKGSMREKQKDEVESPEVQFSIERCMQIALKDARWVRVNKVTETDLHQFNNVLERRGQYDRNPADYKSHYSNWVAKGRPEELGQTGQKISMVV